MTTTRRARLHLTLVMGLLVLLHFYVRPRLGAARLSPDLLLFALVTFAMRSGAGVASVAGFVVGLASDALSPARFGASALAHTLVGYAAAWGRAVFFADNILVNAAFVAVGLWLRDLVLLLASGGGDRPLGLELAVYAPLQGVITAAAGAVVLFAARQFLDLRVDT
ncbi:MAG TPA: rod shape-determining protein MreD [Gemmatimonadales bacterium]|nr:rod shape-determining protein MreD [Gemmatimonadales bacterium]